MSNESCYDFWFTGTQEIGKGGLQKTFADEGSMVEALVPMLVELRALAVEQGRGQAWTENMDPWIVDQNSVSDSNPD